MELHAITLDKLTIKEYLIKILTIVDALTSIGNPIPSSHHIYVILEGLSADYASVISVTESNFDVIDLDEVEILLGAHELRLSKFKKTSVPDLVSLNLTQIVPSHPFSDEVQTASSNSSQSLMPTSIPDNGSSFSW